MVPLLKELLLVSKSSLAILSVLVAIFSCYVIKTLPSNAESREDQDSDKKVYMMNKNSATASHFCQGVAKSLEKK